MAIDYPKFAIQFKDVSLKLQERIIFKSLSLMIPINSFCLILGPTGSGKSTLLRLIKGIIPYYFSHPVQGEISLFGEIKSELNYLKQSLEISYLYQDPELQFVGSTVEQDLAFGLENLGIAPEKIQNILNQLDNDFPILNSLKHRSPHTLSGGEITIVEFLASILIAPKVIMCDEPLASLDKLTQNLFINYLMKNLHANRTCIITTHRIKPFLHIASYFIVLDPVTKNIAFQGTKSGFIDNIDKFLWLENPF